MKRTLEIPNRKIIDLDKPMTYEEFFNKQFERRYDSALSERYDIPIEEIKNMPYDDKMKLLKKYLDEELAKPGKPLIYHVATLPDGTKIGKTSPNGMPQAYITMEDIVKQEEEIKRIFEEMDKED